MIKEKNRRYTFDFYHLTQDAEDLFSLSPKEALEIIMKEQAPSSYSSYGCTRELFGLVARGEEGSYGGQIRKIRKADLPEVGTLGRDGKKLELETGEGVIEKNFFVYYPENSLLIIHRNDDANSALHLTQILSSSIGVRYFATPLIRPDDAEKLLNNELKIKKFSVKIPKPTNPELYPQDTISGHAVALLDQSGADSLDVVFTIDSKLESSAGKLTAKLQSAIGTLLSMGASTAKLVTDDNGKILPIDLIANRIYSTQTARAARNFPSSTKMFELADLAKKQQSESINAYFGGKNRII